MSRRCTALAFAALLWSAPASVFAQGRNLDIARFRPTPDRQGFLGIPGTRTPGDWAWTTSMWFGYASDELSVQRLDIDETLAIVAHRVTADFSAQLGLTGRISLLLNVPLILWQDTDPEPLDGGPPLAVVAWRDPFAAVRVRILGDDAAPNHDRAEGAGLAVQAGTTVPVGQEYALAGEGAPQLEAMVIGDFRFLDFAVGANFGFRHRFGEPRIYGELFRNEVFFGGAIQVPTILIANTSAIAEVRAVTNVDDGAFDEPTTAVEGDLGVRWAEGDLAMTWLVGTGFNGGVGTPGFRGMFGLEFAPRTHDLDGDGMADEQDGCPRLPEDIDGFEDGDGCPDLDNDGDLIADDDDRCPDEAADFDADEDDDGCTDAVRDQDGDGVADREDACPSSAEDHDGFEDDDGCPDLDNDADGVSDAQDRCPTLAEDADRFEDDDGCPDPDNDGDGIGDPDDACADVAEDPDGFEDTDGCPDLDNDRDGVLDAADQCADQAEVLNGVTDDDGCPDRGGRARWTGEPESGLNGQIRFTRTGELDPSAAAAVDQLAHHLYRRWDARWEIRIGGDSDARAVALRAALMARGVPETLFAVGLDATIRGATARAFARPR